MDFKFRPCDVCVNYSPSTVLCRKKYNQERTNEKYLGYRGICPHFPAFCAGFSHARFPCRTLSEIIQNGLQLPLCFDT